MAIHAHDQKTSTLAPNLPAIHCFGLFGSQCSNTKMAIRRLQKASIHFYISCIQLVLFRLSFQQVQKKQKWSINIFTVSIIKAQSLRTKFMQVGKIKHLIEDSNNSNNKNKMLKHKINISFLFFHFSFSFCFFGSLFVSQMSFLPFYQRAFVFHLFHFSIFVHCLLFRLILFIHFSE